MQKCKVEPHSKTQTDAPSTEMLSEHLREEPTRKRVAAMAQKAIVGEKVGMTQVWGDDQRVIPVTVLRVEPVRVVQVKTTDRDGYTALQVTYGHKNA